RLVRQLFTKETPVTIGANFSFIKQTIGNHEYKFKLCDIAGQASFEMVRKNYMINSHGALMVFDLTDQSSLQKLEKWIIDYVQVNSDKEVSILLVGNKLDLADERKVSLSDVNRFLKLANSHEKINNSIIGYIETSALNGVNINIGFDQLSRAIISK
ncbi:MAG: GTP-binding protein, partial [Candidatus Heimdallarchaeota archaeon]|nr:GTP-binding protein [Candidatus Heimdallarchaeota archaeon]